MKRTTLITLLILLTALTLTSCLAGTNPYQGMENEFGSSAGFLKGLWHGFIALFTFFISLFTENINVYEVYNNGGWYDAGFVLGASIFFSGGGRASKRKWADR